MLNGVESIVLFLAAKNIIKVFNIYKKKKNMRLAGGVNDGHLNLQKSTEQN